jgi:hypothetical protein
MKHLYPVILFIALSTYSAAGISQTIQKSELINFTTQVVTDKVWLAWSTKQEENINYYGIERSYDNEAFAQVAMLFPAEESAATNNYSYKDPIKNITATAIYYRLKMVDKDGHYKYSETRTVQLGSSNESAKLAAYPNPVTNELHISLPSDWINKTINCQLLNTGGRIIRSFTIQQTTTIGLSGVPAGTYYIKAVNGKEISTQQIVISRN